MRVLRSITILILLFTIFCSVCAYGADFYNVKDISLVGYNNCEAFGINDEGNVVCQANKQQETADVYTYSLNASSSCNFIIDSVTDNYSPYRINNNGLIIGDKYHTSLWWDSSGQETDIMLGYQSFAYGINNDGLIVGTAIINNKYRPYAWNIYKGQLNIEKFNSMSGGLLDVNNSGVATGCYEDTEDVSHSYVWSENDGITEISSPDFKWSQAFAINNKGQIAGRYGLANGDGGLFIWSKEDGMKIVSTFSNELVYPFAINDSGVIVGKYGDSAFCWDSVNGLTILGLGAANDINEEGQIAGKLIKDDGSSHAIIWQPVPEPSSILALFCGLGSLSAFKILKRK